MLKTIALLLIFTAGTLGASAQVKGLTENDFYGVWKWVQIGNSEEIETVPIEEFTFGMAKFVSTEYSKDSICYEVKNKLGSTELGEPLVGRWYYDKNKNTLNTKNKNKWMSSEVSYYSKDTLIINMMGPLQLKMIRQRK